MSDEKAVTTTEEEKYAYQSRDGQDVTLSPKSVRKHLVSGKHPVSDTEVLMFMSMCRYQGLNPFLKEAYLIKYAAGDDNPASIVTARIVYEKRAAQHEQFAGMKSGIIVDKSGEITYRAGSFHMPGETIVGGWAEGHRKDWEIPRRVEVAFAEYDAGRALWKSKPGTMIEKVAIVQCLRAMFPQEMQGLYGEEELEQPIDVTPTETPAVTGQKEAMRKKLSPDAEAEIDAAIDDELAEMTREPPSSPSDSLMGQVEARVEQNRDAEADAFATEELF
jgi:phage recombination protein Bet